MSNHKILDKMLDLMLDSPQYREIKRKESFDTVHTQLAVCPHCGKEFEDSWELCQKDEDIYEYDCDQCEKPFSVQAIITVTYTTKKLEEPEDA